MFDLAVSGNVCAAAAMSDRAARAGEWVDVPSAQGLTEGSASALAVERVNLSKALGRVVGVAIRAGADIVPYPRSAMDGYAVRAVDAQTAALEHCVLPVTSIVYAARGSYTHVPRTATAIATGAPLPLGADAVVPFEEVERRGDDITITHAIEAGDNVFPSGEDAKYGELLVEEGERLHAGSIALLASAGIDQVPVVQRPRVAIVCTGDELVPVDVAPMHGQIRNSNGSMLSALVAETGAEVVQCCVVSDDGAALEIALQKALNNADLVITSGGASEGPRDLVKANLEHLGTSFDFRSIAMRPGRPTAFGTRDRTLVAVLPGNPAAAFVGFVELVRPALLRLTGLTKTRLPRIQAELGAGSEAKAKVDRCSFLFARATVQDRASQWSVTPLANQCSSLTRTAAAANCLIVLPPGSRKRRQGDLVTVDLLPWTSFVA